MITPIIKDNILEMLVSDCPNMSYSGSLESMSQKFSQPEEVVNQILDQFDRKGLIKYRPFMGGSFSISIKVDAHDYFLSGGHVGEYEILSLEKTMDKNKFDKLTTSINTIFNFFTAVKANT